MEWAESQLRTDFISRQYELFKCCISRLAVKKLDVSRVDPQVLLKVGWETEDDGVEGVGSGQLPGLEMKS